MGGRKEGKNEYLIFFDKFSNIKCQANIECTVKDVWIEIVLNKPWIQKL